MISVLTDNLTTIVFLLPFCVWKEHTINTIPTYIVLHHDQKWIHLHIVYYTIVMKHIWKFNCNKNWINLSIRNWNWNWNLDFKTETLQCPIFSFGTQHIGKCLYTFFTTSLPLWILTIVPRIALSGYLTVKILKMCHLNCVKHGKSHKNNKIYFGHTSQIV